jgi:branched-chain amino acid transport system permease protein
MELLGASLLSGVSIGILFFLVGSGLSVIMGLMGIVNLAHGSLFLVGGYLGITVANLTGNFIFGILAGVGAAGITGLAIERGVLTRLYKRHLDQILVTFGFVYIINNVHLWIYGGWPKAPFVPSILTRSVFIGIYGFPSHRIAIIVIGVVVFFGLWWFEQKTRIGAIIRAGMDDSEMVSGLGIKLTPITVGVFFLGAALAGFAGIIGAPLLGGINLTVDSTMLAVALAVVIVGGVGSIQGAFVAALIIGVANVLAITYLPAIDIYAMYIVMVCILVLRPYGLLGRKL